MSNQLSDGTVAAVACFADFWPTIPQNWLQTIKSTARFKKTNSLQQSGFAAGYENFPRCHLGFPPTEDGPVVTANSFGEEKHNTV